MATLSLALLLLILTQLSNRDQPGNPAVGRPLPAATSQPVLSASPLPSPSALPAVLDEQVLGRVKEAIRLYASYPNKLGRENTLAQLRPLITDAALADVMRQWPDGPAISTAEFKATAIALKPPGGRNSANQVVLEAFVTQEATFATTGSKVYTPTILVSMEYQDGRWVIKQLYEAGSGQ